MRMYNYEIVVCVCVCCIVGLMLEVVMSQCNEVSSPSSPALCDRLSEAKKD